jgi:predicted MPP superfamily phosphohydrolase
VNWGWLLLRIAFGLTVLATLFLSQRFWYRAIWRVTSHWSAVWLRVAARLLYVLALIAIILAIADGFRMGRHGHLIPRDAMLTIFAGLWFSSAVFAFLAVKLVHGVERIWTWLRKAFRAKAKAEAGNARQPHALPAAVERVPDPSRRYFFRTATALAGATPFLSAVYGFAAERLAYQVRRIEIPIPNLPSALDGMQIMQISDIHLSGYMTRSEVRRAVDMANDLNADLAVVTGDFITGASDPIADCIDEVSRLHAPLGVWGCNGNHEIYAKAEDAAQQLFAQAGMKLLRQENAQLTFRGAQFNLIGVDYQRERNNNGHRTPMLANLDPLIRRDMPNILLSHNPNTFNRAAELGVELSLAGHTHGGQIQVEILDHRLTPARFISDYVAGLYQRPLLAPASQILVHPVPPSSASPANREPSAATSSLSAPGWHVTDQAPALSNLYVNRGLGTVGAPVRLGVPPEISLLVLRRA